MLYAALQDRILVVRGERRSFCAQTTQWDLTPGLVGAEVLCLDASPEVPSRVFAGTVDAGLQRSRDAGESWEAVGSFEDRVTAVTVSPHDPATVWVGTEPSAVYRSTDAGENFEKRPGLTELPGADQWSFPPRPHTHHVRWIEVHPTNPDQLAIAIEAGALVRSADAGATWQPHPESARRDNHTIRSHADAPERLYAAAGDGYAESTDDGDTWEYPEQGLDHRYVWGLAVDPGDPETVIVSAAKSARRAHRTDSPESFVYRRDGETDGWVRAMDGLPEPRGTSRAVLAAGDGPGEFLALTNRGIFRTLDGARQWNALDVPWSKAYESQVCRGLAVV